MPGTRSRLASKNHEMCTICSKPNGDNWISFELCERWTHSECMGYSVDEYKFLERSANVKFMCTGCSTTGSKLGGGKYHEDITRGIEELKDILQIAKSVMQSIADASNAPQNQKAKYSDVLKSGNEYALELRFSGIPEYNSSNENEKIEGAKIFEHEEKALCECINKLGVNPNEVFSFRRLGKFDPNFKNPGSY